MRRTANAAGKLFLIKRQTRDYLVQFIEVSGQHAHSAVIRYYEQLTLVSGFNMATIPLSDLTEVDQEAAKAIWLLQTGEEL
jgi:hypothetical protein